MSLFCPATLIVARHGEAEYPHSPDLLSDEGGWLTALGREQAAALADSVRARRIAAVYTSTPERAVQTGAIVAEALGVRARAVAGLEEFGVGDLVGARFDDPRLLTPYAAWLAGDHQPRIPGAESGAEVLARLREALTGIADLHRGESVLVVSHGGVMSLGLPGLALGGPPPPIPPLANCATVELSIGDDGWALGAWPGGDS